MSDSIVLELAVKVVSLSFVIWAATTLSRIYLEAVLEVGRTCVALNEFVYSSDAAIPTDFGD